MATSVISWVKSQTQRMLNKYVLTWKRQESDLHLFIQEKQSSIPVILTWGRFCLPSREWAINSWRHFWLSWPRDRVLLASSGDDLLKDAVTRPTMHKKIIRPHLSTSAHTQPGNKVQASTLLLLRFPWAKGWRGHRFAKWLLCKAKNG